MNMNENQSSNKSHPTASSKRSRKLSASARKEQRRREKEERRRSDFSKIIDEGNGKSVTQRQPFLHSSRSVAPRGGTQGNYNRDEGDAMRHFDNAIKQHAASTDQQNELENETASSEGILTQDMAEVNLEAILQDHNSKESSSSEGSSSRLTQEMMSTIEDNSACKQAAQLKPNNDNGPLQPSKMRSTESAASKPSPLSKEMKAKIEAKRLKALELRRQRMMKQQNPADIEVAKNPHPQEATRQVSLDSRFTSAATKPSLDSSTTSRVMNAQIAPQQQSQHPSAAMKRSSNREMETASARMLSQDSIEPSSVPMVEGLSFYDDTKDHGDQKKESRRKSVGVTLTQQGFVERNVTKKMKVERQTFPTDDYTADWHCGKRHVKFMKGDVWKSSHPDFEGWLFLVEYIDFQKAHAVAKVHSYMKLEDTFIGQEEAAKLEHTGYVLVKKLVKKHRDILPADGYIKLKDLSERMMPEDIPPQMHLNTRHLALRYEEDEDTVSYYTKLGTKIGNQGQTQKPRVLDCFAGGGGMSVGIGESQYFSDKSYKLEMDPEACETLRANFPESTVFQTDIRDFNEKFRRGEINLFKSLIDWLHLSPPCQGFSRVNTSGGEKDIQNNNCTLECLETVRLLQPSHVTMENVPGILDEGSIVRTAERSKRSYLQELAGGLLSENYQVRICKKLNAQNYGDPQDRERVFLAGCENGYALPSPPAPTHGKEPHLKDVVTARDALSDLENVAPTNDGKVRLKNGKWARGHYSKDSKRDYGKHEPDVELQADLPSRTIRKKNKVVHYNRKRNVTLLERARLMSFPDTHEFKGKTGSQSDQIGNAIPVCMATAIAKAVAESFRLGLHEPPSPS